MKIHLSKLWSRVQKFITIFILQKVQFLILKFNIKHVYGPEKIDYGLDELIVLCLVRDGQMYIKSFVEHYFSLGVKHIVLLDNNSTDDTVPIAQKQKNMTVFRSNLPFKKYKLVMRQYLIRRFGQNRWSLYVDIDELFEFPFSDAISLSSLLEYLNAKSYTAVVAHMLDMFSNEPLSNLSSKENDSLMHTYRYYDLTDILKMDYCFPRNIISNDKIKICFGGIRKTLFMPDIVGAEGLDILTKHPLIFLDKKIKPMYLHEHDVRNAHIADFTCILFHYKFLSDFYERVLQAVREENYGNKSVQYKKYYQALKQNPNLQIKQETSQQLHSVNDLVDNQFLVVSEDYVNWVNEYSNA